MKNKFYIKIVDEIPKILIFLSFSIIGSIILIFLKFGSFTIDITGLATLLLVFAAFGQIIYTGSVLKQYKKEEKIKYKAYLSIKNEKIENIKMGEFDKHLVFQIINNGATPAINLQTKFFFLIGGEKEGESSLENSHSMYLGPNNIKKVMVPVKEVELNKILGGEKNRCVFELCYEDYLKNKRIFTGEYKVIENENGMFLAIDKQYEK